MAKSIEPKSKSVKKSDLTDAEVQEMERLGNRPGNTPEETARWRELEERRIAVPAEDLVDRGLADRHLTMFRDKGRKRWYVEIVVERDPRYRAEGGNALYDAQHFRRRLHELALRHLQRARR